MYTEMHFRELVDKKRMKNTVQKKNMIDLFEIWNFKVLDPFDGPQDYLLLWLQTLHQSNNKIAHSYDKNFNIF